MVVESTDETCTFDNIYVQSNFIGIYYYFNKANERFSVSIEPLSEFGSQTIEEKIAKVTESNALMYDDLQFEQTTGDVDGTDTDIYYYDGGEFYNKEFEETRTVPAVAIFELSGYFVTVSYFGESPESVWDNAYLDLFTFSKIQLYDVIPAYLYSTNDDAEPEGVWIYSVEELEEYIDGYHDGTAPGGLDMDKYDAAFFEDNFLYLTLVTVTGSSPVLEVGGVAQSEDSVSVRITRPQEPTSPDMASWILVLEMDHSMAEKQIKVRLENKTVIVDTPEWRNPFVDIKEDDWFCGDVKYVYKNGIMLGTEADVFDPQVSLSRGMIVTMLYRQAGAPSVDGLSNPFTDVPENKWYTDAIKWAYASGIVNGTSKVTYAPDEPIKRQDFAAILYRYNNEVLKKSLPVKRAYSGFNDDSLISDYAKAAVQNFYEARIINGKSEDLFDPKSTATRAEAAAMIHRFLILD